MNETAIDVSVSVCVCTGNRAEAKRNQKQNDRMAKVRRNFRIDRLRWQDVEKKNQQNKVG